MALPTARLLLLLLASAPLSSAVPVASSEPAGPTSSNLVLLAETVLGRMADLKAKEAREKRATNANLAALVTGPLDVIVRKTNESTTELKTRASEQLKEEAATFTSMPKVYDSTASSLLSLAESMFGARAPAASSAGAGAGVAAPQARETFSAPTHEAVASDSHRKRWLGLL